MVDKRAPLEKAMMQLDPQRWRPVDFSRGKKTSIRRKKGGRLDEVAERSSVKHDGGGREWVLSNGKPARADGAGRAMPKPCIAGVLGRTRDAHPEKTCAWVGDKIEKTLLVVASLEGHSSAEACSHCSRGPLRGQACRTSGDPFPVGWSRPAEPFGARGSGLQCDRHTVRVPPLTSPRVQMRLLSR
jgi:hypothetical protein